MSEATTEDRLASALLAALDELALVLEQAERLGELYDTIVNRDQWVAPKVRAEARLLAARLQIWEERPAIAARRRIMMRALAEYRADRATG